MPAPELVIRSARADDLSRVARFPQNPDELFYVHPTAHFPLTAEQLLPNFQNRQGNTVAEQGGVVVAFANYISIKAEGDATIGNVVVDPAQRGTGAGKALLEFMMRKAAEEYGCRRALIPCFNENTPGLLFYQRLGFTPSAYEPREKPDGKKVVLFYLEKRLTPQ
ncbi:MAG TPA: GNAT family N-acetyltransferase [Dongiaceae bacterium]|nr:GNAT family N-acetyltransferase [Dongiaceae bacterium]